MLDRIEHDWQAWAATPRAQRRLARWANTRPALDGWELGDLHRPRSSPRTDAMQAALVALAQAGDHAAVSTILTQLCPGLWCIVRSGRRRSGTLAAFGADDVAAVACETVMLHPLDRRPGSIAANILLDTRQRLSRAGRNSDRAGSFDGVFDGGHVPLSIADDLDARVAELDVLAQLAGAIDRSTADDRSRRLSTEIAFRAWFLDEPAPAIAAAVGLRPDAVRARLSRLRASFRASAPIG